MTKVLCTKSKLVNVADSIRDKLDIENTMTIDQMKVYIDQFYSIKLAGIPIRFVNQSVNGIKYLYMYGFDESGELKQITLNENESKKVYFPYTTSPTGKVIIYTPVKIEIPRKKVGDVYIDTPFTVASTLTLPPMFAIYKDSTSTRFMYLDLNINRVDVDLDEISEADYVITITQEDVE